MDERHHSNAPTGNFQYVVAVLVMAALGIIAVLGITLMRPSQDNTVLIGAVFGFLMPTTLALLAFMKSQETHLSVNSRLDALLKEARLSSRAEGVVEGRAVAERRADTLALAGDTKTAAVLAATAPAIKDNTAAIVENTEATDINSDVRSGVKPKKFG